MNPEERQAYVNDYIYRAYASRNIRRVIRAFCMECMGGYRIEIDECSSNRCPLRFWKDPETSAVEGFRNALSFMEGIGTPHAEKLRRKLREGSDVGDTDKDEEGVSDGS
jgi:hypothetical protein